MVQGPLRDKNIAVTIYASRGEGHRIAKIWPIELPDLPAVAAFFKTTLSLRE